MNKIILHSKPHLFPDYHCSIPLSKEEVDISDIETRARAEGYREQTSQHITVMGGRIEESLANRLELMPGPDRQKIIDNIISLLEKFKWEFEPKEIYHVKKTGTFGKESTVIEHRQSYIRTIEMPDMEIFFKELNKLLGTNFPMQFSHITLFTKGEREGVRYYGIPIPSVEEFKKLNPIKIS